ncbi:unnamed protein product, partial [Urochloa humidicola]
TSPLSSQSGNKPELPIEKFESHSTRFLEGMARRFGSLVFPAAASNYWRSSTMVFVFYFP